LVWISTLSIIAYLIGFFGSFGEPKAGLYLEKCFGQRSKFNNFTDKTSEEDSVDFYSALVCKTKVKSISQYMGPQPLQQKHYSNHKNL
jgi:hypothetical protein